MRWAIRFDSSGIRTPRQKKGRLKVFFLYSNCYLCSLEDTDFFLLSISYIHTYTSRPSTKLSGYIVASEIPGQFNSHLYVFSVSCLAGHSRIEYKVPDISAEKEKNGKLYSVTSTQGPGEGMQFIESSTPPNLILAFLSHLLSAHAKLPCMGKRMPQSRGPTFGKQVLLCL